MPQQHDLTSVINLAVCSIRRLLENFSTKLDHKVAKRFAMLKKGNKINTSSFYTHSNHLEAKNMPNVAKKQI